MDKRYQLVLDDYNKIQKELGATSDPAKLKELGKKQSEMFSLTEKIQQLKKLEKQIEENKKLLNEKDEAIKKMAE